jgi:hypothetical protein
MSEDKEFTDELPPPSENSSARVFACLSALSSFVFLLSSPLKFSLESLPYAQPRDAAI